MNYDFNSMQQSPALCQPAVRMVAIRAWASLLDGGDHKDPDDYEADFQVLDVVAIGGFVETGYRERGRFGGDLPPVGPSHKMNVENGLTMEYQRVSYVPLVLDDEFNFELISVGMWSGHSDSARAVVCPWSREEDDIKLSGVISDLKERAVKAEMGAEEHKRKKKQVS